jgi:hypothetical protein
VPLATTLEPDSHAPSPYRAATPSTTAASSTKMGRYASHRLLLSLSPPAENYDAL